MCFSFGRSIGVWKWSIGLHTVWFIRSTIAYCYYGYRTASFIMQFSITSLMNWRQASFQIKKTKQKEIHHQQPHHHHPLHLSRYRRHFKRPLQSNAFPFLFSLNIRKKFIYLTTLLLYRNVNI